MCVCITRFEVQARKQAWLCGTSRISTWPRPVAYMAWMVSAKMRFPVARTASLPSVSSTGIPTVCFYVTLPSLSSPPPLSFIMSRLLPPTCSFNNCKVVIQDTYNCEACLKRLCPRHHPCLRLTVGWGARSLLTSGGDAMVQRLYTERQSTSERLQARITHV